jgi:hypothetical protein
MVRMFELRHASAALAERAAQKLSSIKFSTQLLCATGCGFASCWALKHLRACSIAQGVHRPQRLVAEAST